MKKHTRLYALICAALVSALWGISFIGSQKAVDGGLNAFSLIFVRYVAAVPALLIVALAGKADLRMKLRDVPALIGTTLSGITVYYYCEIQGILNTSPSAASLITATIPVFCLLTGIMFKKQKPKKRMWPALILSLTGVYLVVSSGKGKNSFIGVLFMFVCCVCWVIYLEMTAGLIKKYDSLAVTFWQSAAALVTLVPLMLREHTAWGSVTISAYLWAALFLGLICSGACFAMNNFSVSVLSPQVNAFFLNLSPVVTALFELILMGTVITPLQIAGGAIVLTSLFLVSGDK